jgi:SH3-like domain-containing protein
MPYRTTMTKKRIGSGIVILVSLIIAAAAVWAVFAGKRQPGAAQRIETEATASTTALQVVTGPSGLPLPRFVSLKADKVNVRRGPSSDHPVAWVFQRKGYPVEIVAEFENWRRVRDSDGDEGWILQSMLTGKRSAIVAPWRAGKPLPLRSGTDETASVVAQLEPGVMSQVKSCDGQWCELDAQGYDGYVPQDMLWGVYPGEQVD